MCPYCGEEVPDDSSRCWKCGTELTEGGAPAPTDDEEELEVPADDDGEPTEKKVELVNCPFCDSPMPKSALRCRECGRTVRSPEAARGAVAWRLGPWLIFAAVAVIAIAVIATVVTKKMREKEKQHDPPIQIKFVDLDTRITPLRKLSATIDEKRQAIWNDDFKGKFVKWPGQWILKATKIGEEWEVELSEKEPKTLGKTDKPSAVVTFLPATNEDEAGRLTRTLKTGERITYTARLVDFGGRAAFTLDNGTLENN
jgi:hypothetical protein